MLVQPDQALSPPPVLQVTKNGGAWVQGYCDGRELVKQNKKRYFCRENLHRLLTGAAGDTMFLNFTEKKNFPQNLEIRKSFLPRRFPSVLLTQAHLTKPYTEITTYEKPINYSPGKQFAKVFSAKISSFLFHQFSPIAVALYQAPVACSTEKRERAWSGCTSSKVHLCVK